MLPMEPLFFIIALVALFAFAVGRYVDRRGRSRGRVDPLVTACLGDRRKAQRLADFERRKASGITDSEARRRALDRLTRDRTR